MRDIDFNRGWIFWREGAENARQRVTLPHDGLIDTPRNPDQENYFLLAGYEGRKLYYEKTFFVPEDEQKQEMILEFEAIFCNSTVYVNGTEAGRRIYGYVPLAITLNPYLKFGADNTIRVECDIPKDGYSRWYSGGGIYRPVHLYMGGRTHIQAPYGIHVTTLSIDPVKVSIDVDVAGDEAATAAIYLTEHGLEMPALEDSAVVQSGHAHIELTVPGAKLWSADAPNLYDVTVTLKAENGAVLDEAKETFGIRTISVNAQEGLLINGKQTFLRGGCIHNDNGVIGVENNDATELHRAKLIKAAGFNAIRSAHHPMSRSLMGACDAVGLYVMDEAFDYWYMRKGGNPHNDQFLQCFEEDTRLMTEDAYNHPSVILYSIGNEIPEAGSLKGVRVGKRIVDVIHSIDRTRLTNLSPAVHWLREYLRDVPYLTEDEDEWIAKSPENQKKAIQHYIGIFMGAAANLPENEKGDVYPETYVKEDENATKNLYPYLDVAGYNYYEDHGGAKYDRLHELHPERPLLGTETRAENVVSVMDYARKHPYLIGDFIWTLQDHLGEVNVGCEHYGPVKKSADPRKIPNRDYPWLLNHGGMLDLEGVPLAALHRLEFAWNPDKKGIYLAVQPPIHDGVRPEYNSYLWTDSIESYSFADCAGKKSWADVYTDAASVEVLVNGQSAGRADTQEYLASVPIVYEPGEITAIGYDADGNELYRTSLKSADTASLRLTASADRTQIRAGGEDFVWIDFSVRDRNGILNALPDYEMTLSVEGSGILEGFGSTNPKAVVSYKCPRQMTYQGRAYAVIRSGEESGEIHVHAQAEGLSPADITIEVK